jgi:hypothetical protein
MRTYTYEETLEMLKDAVDLQGEDYVYSTGGPSCYYAMDGQPSCIVGHVLVEVGVPVEQLTPRFYGGAGEYSGGIAEQVLGKLERAGVVEFTRKAKNLLAVAQYHQDVEIPWGECLELAITVAEGTPGS